MSCSRVNFTFNHHFRNNAYICGRKRSAPIPDTVVTGVEGGGWGLCRMFDCVRNMSIVACIWNIANFWFCINVLLKVVSDILPHIPKARVIPATVQIWARSVLSEKERHGTCNNMQWKCSWHYSYTTMHGPTSMELHIFLNIPFSGRRWLRRDAQVRQVSVKIIFGWTCIRIKKTVYTLQCIVIATKPKIRIRVFVNRLSCKCWVWLYFGCKQNYRSG